MKKSSLFLFVFLVFLSACQTNQDQLVDISGMIDSVRVQYAPDKRVAVFDIEFKKKDETIILTGESDQLEAVKELIETLYRYGMDVEDQINRLPDASVGEMKYAMVNNSVANIRSKSKHSSELATQEILGTKLKVLKRLEEWYLVQSPDDYIAWVDHGGVQLMTASEQNRWSKLSKIIYMKNYGNVYLDEKETTILSDIVLGGQLIKMLDLENHYQVQFPDNRIGFVRKSEAMRVTDWKATLQPSGELIEQYARDLLGSPYLWGGTSTKGMDCSGFTKTAYRMNGMIIPRDASQQINAGVVVDPDLKFEGLQKGDLLFFGKFKTDSTSQRVTHVGLWIGNGEFIHSSQKVRISSIDTASVNYDEFNKNRYLGTRRYLNNQGGHIEKM